MGIFDQKSQISLFFLEEKFKNSQKVGFTFHIFVIELTGTLFCQE